MNSHLERKFIRVYGFGCRVQDAWVGVRMKGVEYEIHGSGLGLQTWRSSREVWMPDTRVCTLSSSADMSLLSETSPLSLFCGREGRARQII